MAWNDLTLSDKARMIQLAVNSGITDLRTIEEVYNKYATGGPKRSYEDWKSRIASQLGILVDDDPTYDYEGFYNRDPERAYAMLNGDPYVHFTDEFKTVYHPTFSAPSENNDGSIYSGVVHPKYNPKGLVGGTWSPDYSSFTISLDGYRGPVSMDERKAYLEQAENNGVTLLEADGSYPIYDGVPWLGVLPAAVITANQFKDGGSIHIKKKNQGHTFETGGPEEKTYYTAKWKKLPKSYQKGILQKAKEMNIPEEEVPAWYESGRLNAALGPNEYPNHGRLRANDSPTREESEALENSMNGMVYDGANHRRPNMKYAIPYIEDKEIRVKGVGRVTTNALDSLAKYAAITNVPLEEALGIPAQETGFGAIPYYNYDSKIDGETISSRALGNSSYFRNFGVIPAENFMRDFRYNKPDWKGEYISQDVPPLQHALEYWKAGKYNPGDPNHTEAVRAKGRKLMSDPNIQKWMKESKYVKKDKK